MRENIREREKKGREKGKQRGLVDGETHRLEIPKATILSTVYALLKNVVILKKISSLACSCTLVWKACFAGRSTTERFSNAVCRPGTASAVPWQPGRVGTCLETFVVMKWEINVYQAKISHADKKKQRTFIFFERNRSS
jgi:hypothetical protein